MCALCGSYETPASSGPKGDQSFDEGKRHGPDMPLDQQRKAAADGLRISQEIAREQGGLGWSPIAQYRRQKRRGTGNGPLLTLTRIVFAVPFRQLLEPLRPHRHRPPLSSKTIYYDWYRKGDEGEWKEKNEVSDQLGDKASETIFNIKQSVSRCV